MTPQWTHDRDALHLEIAKLRGQLVERDIRIEQLNELLIGQPVDLWRMCHFTQHEEKIVSALMTGRLCTKEYLLDCLYAMDPDGEAQIKIIDVFICKIRKKLNHLGFDIETVWGRGYRFHAETIARIKALCIAPQASAKAA